ncbi:MAG: hypothetical protein CMJ78_00635 [Planctomycetaceae bacterium]|nr:hypothetical protein [Planctomycetaceae bacterium]
MRKLIATMASLMLLASILTVQDVDRLSAQDEVKKADAKEKASAEKKTTRKKPRGRLPNQYGKLGLSTKQRDDIYAIQADYKSKVDELRKQIAALEKEQGDKIVAVLTDTQKTRLDELLKEAAEKASKRKSSSKSSSKSE